MPVVLLTALLAGVMLPVQAVFNARLGRALGSPLWAASVSGAVTTLTLVILGCIVMRGFPKNVVTTDLPWWAWIGGLCGVIALAGMATVVPRLGAATTVAVVITGQVLFSLAIDRFGLFGTTPHPLGFQHILAAILLLSGAVLIR